MREACESSGSDSDQTLIHALLCYVVGIADHQLESRIVSATIGNRSRCGFWYGHLQLFLLSAQMRRRTVASLLASSHSSGWMHASILMNSTKLCQNFTVTRVPSRISLRPCSRLLLRACPSTVRCLQSGQHRTSCQQPRYGYWRFGILELWPGSTQTNEVRRTKTMFLFLDCANIV